MRVLFLYRNAEWLGVEYLSSVLKAAGHETDLLFDPGAGDIEYKLPFMERLFPVKQEMVKRIIQFRPDLVAFSCVTNMWAWTKSLAEQIKNSLDVPIIVGGIHPTLMPDAVLADEHIDMICIGEGEEALLELVNSMESGRIDTYIRNIWFKEGESIKRNPVRPLMQNLDELPYPDKELFYKYGCFHNRLYTMTSRGCPFNCTYCYNHAYRKTVHHGEGPYVRRRSIESVIGELMLFKQKYPIKEVYFYDDIFTLNRKWLDAFCYDYKREIGLPFKCLIRPGTISSEMAFKLKDAGLKYSDVGLESGNEGLRRKLLRRNMPDGLIFETAQILHKAGITFTTLNMVGFPGETKTQMLDTLRMNQKIKPNTALFSTFYPFVGTELYDKALKEGYIDEIRNKEIIEGKGSYKESTMLDHPEKKTIKWIACFAPILVKIPWLEGILSKIAPNLFWRFITIFFSSPVANTLIRASEIIRMYFKTRLLYNKRLR